MHDRCPRTVLGLYQVRSMIDRPNPTPAGTPTPLALPMPPRPVRSPSPSISLSSFHSSFHKAILTYNKRTNNDLLFHPLAPLSQSCNDPALALSLLQRHAQPTQVLTPQPPRISDEQLKSLLTPTLIGLFAISTSDDEGVGLVIVDVCSFRTCILLNGIFVRYYRQRKLS